MSIADTRWGLFVSGLVSGVVRLSSPGQWRATGLRGVAVSQVIQSTLRGVPVLYATRLARGADTVSSVFYRSADAGATWISADGGIAAVYDFHASAYSVAAHPGNDEVLMGLFDQVLRSTDGGLRWQPLFGTIDPSQEGGLNVFGLAVVPRAGAFRIWVAGNDATVRSYLRRSDDLGLTWATAFLPQADSTVLDLDAFSYTLLTDSLDANRAIVGSKGVLWLTTDAGSSWTILLRTKYPGLLLGLACLAEQLWVATSELEPGSATDVLGLYLSLDQGATWDTLAVPRSARGGTALATSARGELLIGTSDGLWRVSRRQ